MKLLLQHVPDRGEHLVRYYGWYSNRSSGDRMRAEWSLSGSSTNDLFDRCVLIPEVQSDTDCRKIADRNPGAALAEEAWQHAMLDQFLPPRLPY